MKKIGFVVAAVIMLGGCANSPYGSSYGGYSGLGASPLGNSATTTDTAAGAAIGAGLGGLAGYAVSKRNNQSAPNCPTGYNCTPSAPPPSCPPGYNCTPQ
jgi:hypothetical protein